MNEPNLPGAETIPTRYSLLSRLQDWGDQESWKDFFDTYWRLIYRVALKSGLSEAEAQDVVQETVLCVAKDIQKFKRERKLGSFKAWLFNITRWRIADQLRKRAPGEPLGTGEHEKSEPSTAEQPAEPQPEIPQEGAAFWEEEWKSNLFNAALARVKRRVKEEHYQIFDLYVLKEWPATKVARLLGVSLGQVYIAKHRVALLVRKELKALETKF